MEEGDRRKEGMKECIEKLSKMGIFCNFFEGIYGKRIDVFNTTQPNVKLLTYSRQEKKIIGFYDTSRRLNGQPMIPGELGASWSHMLLYEKLLGDTENDAYLILEDDVDFDTENFAVVLKDINDLKVPFDIIHLTYSQFFPFAKEEKVTDNLYRPRKQYFNGANAYIVTKAGASKLLSSSQRMVSKPPDDLLSNTYIGRADFTVLIPEAPVFFPTEFNAKSIVNME